VHSCPLQTASRLRIGDEFELYGRCWRVSSVALVPGSLDDYDVGCVPAGAEAMNLAGAALSEHRRL